MPRIRSLKSNVTRDEAIDQFSSGGPVDLLRQAVFGPVRSVAEFYVPFHFYRVEILNRGQREQRVLGLDAVNGSLDLYQFEQLPAPEEVTCVETRNCPPALLDDTQAAAMIRGKVQRVLFTTGFFRVRDLEVTVNPVPGEIHIPYWVGLRGHRTGVRARVVVMDAVRRQVEGAKVRQLLQNWLASV